VGLWRAWYDSGELQAEEWFEKGKRVKVRYLDKNGREIPEPKTKALAK
jgi:antitoxin component YwqK of YwqJK toxin-antitoxin module